MRLHKILLICTGLLLSCKTGSGIPKNYDYTPVLLHLSASKQADSVGFNLVTALPTLLYSKLITGDLALWENSKKRLIVGSQQMLALEKNAVNPFVGGEDLFIHEYWQLFKKNFDYGVQGFTFSGKDKFGKKINYGYVDAPDIINLLKNEYIPSNSSGSSTLTFWDAILSNSYQFNLVQFGENDFRSNPKLSSALQYQAIHDPKIFRENKPIVLTKKLVYKILSPTINSNKENKTFYDILTKYVNENKQTILNASTSSHFKDIMFLPWKIDNVTVTEQWSKYKNIPFQELQNIELFIDKHAITLSKKQLEELNIKINLQMLEEYLSEKRFSFLLEKINDQEIAPQQSEKYYGALINSPWNKIAPK